MRLVRWAWRALGSIQLAAVLLALVLLASALASLFPQMPNGAAADAWLAAAKLRYGSSTELLHSLSLFSVYRAPWFIFLLAGLLVSATSCTLQRLPRWWQTLVGKPAVAHADAFYQGFSHHAEWPVPSTDAGLAAAVGTLRTGPFGYRLSVEGGGATDQAFAHAEQGRWSRLGTLASHAAVLCLLAAVIARPALAWQRDGVALMPGQTLALDSGLNLAVQAGELRIDRHPDGSASEYRVPLSVLRAGAGLAGTDRLVHSGTVRLGHPLKAQGVAFHLLGYGPAVQVTTPKESTGASFATGPEQELTLAQAGLRLRVVYRPESGEGSGAWAPEAASEAARLSVEARTLDGALVSSHVVADGERVEVEGTPITFSLTYYTAWRVSWDPTFGFAVGAGAVLAAATAVSLWLPRRQVWLRIGAGRAEMVGAGEFYGRFEALADAMAQAANHLAVARG